ncbi:KLHDC3 [Scenedesmus sp. PABB004]|nr:KLHDC3 [Scenedesmus sp. PABB004]
MAWSPCFTSLASDALALPRFGHSAVAVPGGDGYDLFVVFGGIGAAQTALGDVLALQVDSGTWFAPGVAPGAAPGARAFHASAALGRRVLVFGGHILASGGGGGPDAAQGAAPGRRRRCFFNDVWQLDTSEHVRCAAGVAAGQHGEAGRRRRARGLGGGGGGKPGVTLGV